jgi:hypothetical protein
MAEFSSHNHLSDGVRFAKSAGEDDAGVIGRIEREPSLDVEEGSPKVVKKDAEIGEAPLAFGIETLGEDAGIDVPFVNPF